MAFCKACGSEIFAEAEICPKCGVRQKPNPQNQLKSPIVAALLSFVWIGIGQIYNGQVGKGILFMILQVLNCFLFLVAIGFLTVPAFWLYGIYDAYTTAEKINRGAIP